MIYKAKQKIEGDMKDIKVAAQKIYDTLKKEGKTTTVDKRLIQKYNLS